MKLQEQEFFASRDLDIAKAPNAGERKSLIAALPATNPGLHNAFVAEKRNAEGGSHFIRNSGRYLLTGRGDINTYAVFAEADREMLSGAGRLGVILPTGIATDSTTQYYFKDLVEHGAIASLYDFENAKPLFEGVHRSFKFCLLTLTGRDLREPAADFAFFARDPTDLDRPGVRFALSPEEITLLNPNTGTCPVFRSRRDAEISIACARRHPVVWSDQAESVGQRSTRFSVLSDLGRAEQRGETTREPESGEDWLPVYEAKLFQQYDHRFATYGLSGDMEKVLRDPSQSITPRLWLRRQTTINHYGAGWTGWVVAYRDIARATDERTMIACVLPAAAADYTVRHLLGNWDSQPLILSVLNSFPFDFLVRLRNNGTHLSDYIVYQVPVPSISTWGAAPAWGRVPFRNWVLSRVLELTYTSADLRSFGAEVDCDRDPYEWNEVRRAQLRAELDAAFFHLYGIERDDVDYIMETFPIVKRKDLAAHGQYRTKRMILEIYDAMAEAEATGVPYASPFDEAGKQ